MIALLLNAFPHWNPQISFFYWSVAKMQIRREFPNLIYSTSEYNKVNTANLKHDSKAENLELCCYLKQKNSEF